MPLSETFLLYAEPIDAPADPLEAIINLIETLIDLIVHQVTR